MKKSIGLSLVGCLTVMMMANPSQAATTTKAAPLTTAEKISNMMKDGLSADDATYYAKLDDMVKSMEANHEQFTFDPNVQAMSDEEVAKDIKKFHQRVLSGDKAAMKKALLTTQHLFNTDEMNKLMEQHKGQSEYEIQYADGSKVTVKNIPAQKKDRAVHTSGYSEYQFGSYNYPGDGSYVNGVTEWSFNSGVSYSKITLHYDFTLQNSAVPYGGVATFTYATGGQASYGVVGIANSNGGVISRTTNNQTTQQPAEANNQVVFNVSGSFSATFGNLSIGVTAGASWTQYVYERIYGDGVSLLVAAKYL